MKARSIDMRHSTGPFTIREADTIWREEGGWFDARWHFTFDRYRDPEQMGVGALRVFNDDRIVAGAEWPLHPHQDIESLTYVVEGHFLHDEVIPGRHRRSLVWALRDKVGRQPPDESWDVLRQAGCDTPDPDRAK